MPAWPGGPCPQCGEDMPEKLVHCQNCRALLNDDLESDSVVIPEFVPLQEIAAMIDLSPRGHFVTCPSCSQELRIAVKYRGRQVQCKFCQAQFRHEIPAPRIRAFYAPCPHCQEELRAAVKYQGTKVACKHCDGKINLLQDTP